MTRKEFKDEVQKTLRAWDCGEIESWKIESEDYREITTVHRATVRIKGNDTYKFTAYSDRYDNVTVKLEYI